MPVFFPGKSHGQRSLVGFSPWDHKELDKAEHSHTRIPGEMGRILRRVGAESSQ